MTGSLDHVQRLNLVMLIGIMEGTVAEIRALWHLQDKLDLDPAEKESIGFYTQSVSGSEVQGWDVTKSIPAKEYDLSEADLARLRKALEYYPRHRVSQVRSWLEPLLEQFPALAELDGKESQNGRR